jgi:hypothetical protein
MRVEITEERLKDAGYNLGKGDIITVADEVGRSWCENGWAKDVEGKVESGERVPGVRELKVHNSKVTGTASQIGGDGNG